MTDNDNRVYLAHLFKNASNKYVAVDCAGNVFIGTKGRMKKAEGADVEFYRDGGTADITLKDGTKIYTPTRLKPHLNGTFNSVEMTRVDATDAKLVASLKIDTIRPAVPI